MSQSGVKSKVVLLVIIALALTAAFGAALGAFDFRETTLFRVAFSDSGALRVGAKVRIAGIEAGHVSSVDFIAPSDPRAIPDSFVQLGLNIDTKMAEVIRENAEFHITTRGVLGEKYVEVVPGTQSRGALSREQVARGFDPPRIDLFLSKVDRILSQFVTLMGEDDGDMKALATSLTRLITRLDQFMANHGDQFGQVIQNASGASQDLKVILSRLSDGMPTGQNLAESLEKVDRLTNTIQRELPGTTRTARKAMADLRAAAQAVKGVAQQVLDGEASFQSLIDRLPMISRWAEDSLRDLAAILSGLAAGQGSVGLLLASPEIHDEVKSLLSELKKRPWRLMWRD
ncbi:MAG: MlaD family protein [Myxococcota bacterium]|nr:MlaD family protein [Myxococcota bacterium]